MKDPKYISTPARNCFYCRYYNQHSNACSAPGSEKIAVFNPILDKDCLLLRYEKTENPKVNKPSFVEKYCVGKKCPYYFATANLCTRPSKCPYTHERDEMESMFDNVIIE